ncbi:Holliday junction resolvase RuvX [Dehalococcoidia bacterium]|nr:Holliday junction resolvase RuvX [Dehalococcoidia bacterium]
MAASFRVLGLDVGEKRIGLAISGGEALLATPYSTLHRKGQEQAIDLILDIVQCEQVGQVVVGLPLSLDGTVGPQAAKTLIFYEALKSASPVEVVTWDERFSSIEAGHLLREAGLSPTRKKGRLDASAATVILQSYLDARR